MRGVGLRVFVLAISVLTTLVALELALRLVGVETVAPVRLRLVGSPTPTSAYDPRLGWVNLPGSAGVLTLPGGRRLTLETNPQGFRHPAPFRRERTGVPRIALSQAMAK